MKSLAILISMALPFLTLSSYAQSQSAEMELTYGQVADSELNDSLSASLLAVQKFNENSLPHEGKALRKIVGRFRDMIDIFAYSLPETGNCKFFVELRTNLDTGYERIGYFKDLFDVQGIENPSEAQYDSNEVKKMIKPVLDWQKSFLNEVFVQKMTAFVANISKDQVGSPKKSELSKFYWKQIEAEPAFEDSARESLRSLVKGLLKKAREEEKSHLKSRQYSQISGHRDFS